VCFAETTTGSTHSRWIDPVSLLPFCRVIRAAARLASEFSNFSRDYRVFRLFGHGIGGHFPLPGGGDDLPFFFGLRVEKASVVCCICPAGTPDED
jgi:hypothetical protein